MTKTGHKGWGVLSVLALLAAWLVASWVIASPLILPYPWAVAREALALTLSLAFWKAAVFTFARVAAAFLLSLVAGALLGGLCAAFPRLASFCRLPVAAVRCVPLVCVILIALFWLGSDAVPVFAATLMSFPVFFTSCLSGFSVEDEKANRVCCVFHLTRTQWFLFSKLPAAAPFLKDAAKNSCGMIWKACAAAEVLCVPKAALGSELGCSQVVLEVPRVFALTVYIVAFGFLCEKLLEAAFQFAKCLYRWTISVYFRYERTVGISKRVQDVGEDALSVNDLSLSYGETQGAQTCVFKNYSETFDAHKVTAIIAPSGSGKSTLLNYVAKNCRSLSYAMQEPCLFNCLTVQQNVQLPIKNALGAARSFEASGEVLAALGLEEKTASFVDTLSGGQRQRVCLARALAFPSDVLLLDEPFESLDVETKARCARYVLEMQKKNARTVLFATHDIREAIELSDVIIVHSKNPMRQVARFTVEASDKGAPARLQETILRALLP